MAMTDADKAEVKELMSDAFAEGLAKFRSKAEEEAAKSQQQNPSNSGGGNGDNNDGKNTGGFSFQGFLLGE